jgi:Tol biopolymer transport system component
MTEIPNEFPLPEGVAQRQRSLLGAHIEAGRRSARTTRRGAVAVAAVILVGGLLVAPALGIGSRLLELIQSPSGLPEVQTPVWSPDGRRIAYLSRRDGTREIYVVSADGSGQRRVTPRDVSVHTPAWSPDGRRIAFEGVRAGTTGVYAVNADGSLSMRDPAIWVATASLARNGHAPAWSPDGRTVAFFSGSKIYLMNADGSEHRPLTKPLGGRKRSLAWSPDGRKLAFLSLSRPCDFCFGLYVVNSDGSGLRNLTSKLEAGRGPGAGPASDPAWSPDGRKLAFVRLNAALGEPIHVVNADGSGLRRLTRNAANDADPTWSPNGRKLAFVSERDGNSEVYVMNANGSGQRSLTRNPAFDADPAWSPDGRKIAFVSNRDGSYGVYVMNADGSGQRRLAQRSP